VHLLFYNAAREKKLLVDKLSLAAAAFCVSRERAHGGIQRKIYSLILLSRALFCVARAGWRDKGESECMGGEVEKIVHKN
jgi:hypothetical protein